MPIPEDAVVAATTVECMSFWLGFVVIALIVLGRMSRTAAAARARADQQAGVTPPASTQPPPLAARAYPTVAAQPLVLPQWAASMRPAARSASVAPHAPAVQIPPPEPGAPGVPPPARAELPVLRELMEIAEETAVGDVATPSPSGPPRRGTGRDVGSVALESTLDSTIESSLLGVPSGPVAAAMLPGAAARELPDDLRVRVISFLADGQEVAAVRMVCDELDCSIIEAVQTVHTVRGVS